MMDCVVLKNYHKFLPKSFKFSRNATFLEKKTRFTFLEVNQQRKCRVQYKKGLIDRPC